MAITDVTRAAFCVEMRYSLVCLQGPALAVSRAP
jgi:hypothetical protein